MIAKSADSPLLCLTTDDTQLPLHNNSLYEIGSTPQEKLTMLAHGFRPAEFAAALATIDVSRAGCFDGAAKQLIVREIERQHGSVGAFTAFLKLRLLLMPLSYERDIDALLARSRDSFRFNLLKAGLAELEPAPGLLCVAAGSGEGKSTLAAALTRFTTTTAAAAAAAAGDPPEQPFLAAWHFCKAADARRQDGVEVARSLAYQLSRRFPATFAPAVLALPPARVRALQRADDAVEMLVCAPLRALPAEDRARAVILIDALDEAQPGASSSTSTGGGGGALANEVIRIVSALQQAGAAVVVTTRPEPHVLGALRGRLSAGAFLLRTPADYLLSSEATDALNGALPEQQQKESATGGAEGEKQATKQAGAVPISMPQELRAALKEKAGHKVFCVVARALFDAHCCATAAAAAAAAPAAPFRVPGSLGEAYASLFELGWPKEAADTVSVTKLLQVLLAAREPPTVAALELLGVRAALPLLPGYGTLFQVRSR